MTIAIWRQCALSFGAAALALLLPIAAGAQASASVADPFAFTQDYQPDPAVWRIADEDTTIYLLGTVHVLPEGFKWRNDRLDAIIAKVDELVLESADADVEQDMARLSGKLETMLGARPPVSSQLPAGLHPKWQLFASQTGQAYSALDQAPLLIGMLGLFVGVSPDSPSSHEHGVETVLEAEFVQSGREISSIESFATIMLSLYRQSDDQAVRDLAGELSRWSGKGPLFPGLHGPEGEDFWAMEHAWAQGQVDDDFDLGFGDGKLGARFRRILLEDRNRAWAGWLKERLDRPGEVLLAVGAGHFEGPDSVQVMLEERGLKAERIH